MSEAVVGRGHKRVVVAVIIAVLVIGSGAAGGYAWLQHKQTPPTTAPTSVKLDENALVGDDRSDSVKIAAQTASVQASGGDTTAAASTLNTAINGTSNTDEKVSLYMQLAALYAANGNKDQALASEDAAIKLQPNNWKIYKNQGSLYTQLGDAESAKVSYQKALELIKGTSDETAYTNELKGLASGAIQ